MTFVLALCFPSLAVQMDHHISLKNIAVQMERVELMMQKLVSDAYVGGL